MSQPASGNPFDPFAPSAAAAAAAPPNPQQHQQHQQQHQYAVVPSSHTNGQMTQYQIPQPYYPQPQLQPQVSAQNGHYQHPTAYPPQPIQQHPQQMTQYYQPPQTHVQTQAQTQMQHQIQTQMPTQVSESAGRPRPSNEYDQMVHSLRRQESSDTIETSNVSLNSKKNLVAPTTTQPPPPPPDPPQPHTNTSTYPSTSTSTYPDHVEPTQYPSSVAVPVAVPVPASASPLPNPSHVLKSGYILSRISLRTIFMKRWKQSYYIQYGPPPDGGSQLFFFRTKEDADDWLRNPYHDVKARRFLVKLKIDFQNDLFKPNVKGYRAPNVTVKTYQNELLHQFKLERWMDYGPAIAAAFASQQAHEIQEFREMVLKCIRQAQSTSQTTHYNHTNNYQSQSHSHTMPMAQPQPQLHHDTQQALHTSTTNFSSAATVTGAESSINRDQTNEYQYHQNQQNHNHAYAADDTYVNAAPKPNKMTNNAMRGAFDRFRRKKEIEQESNQPINTSSPNQYFQYDEETLAVDRMQTQQAMKVDSAQTTNATGRYSNY